MAHDRRVSVVVPCFNEGRHLTETLSTLRTWLTPPPQLVVVDDGSRDETLQQARTFAAAHEGVIVHAMERNRGKGAALRAALPLATGERVVFIDADLAFDRTSVMAVLRALDAADVAVGNRRHRQSRYSVPVRLFGFLYRRHLVGFAFNLGVRGLLQVGLRDTQCGLKGFRREALHRMAPALAVDGFALDVELIVAARAHGLRIADVPVDVRYDTAMSSVRLVRSALRMSRDLIGIWRRRMAGHYAPGGASRRLQQTATTASPSANPPNPANRPGGVNVSE
jgi:glycosyltransferase involved in cell wall biosynthesis